MLKRRLDDLMDTKSLVGSGCAELLETIFAAVPRELMERLVSQKAKKNPGAYPQSSEHLP